MSNQSSSLLRDDIRKLFERYAPVVHRRARAIVGRDADAWDVVQEVFEKMLTQAQTFRAEARPMTWVYRITTNVALNHLRSRGLREPGHDDAVSSEASHDTQSFYEARETVRRLQSTLDERELAVVALLVFDGLTQEEIADTLGLSRKTIGRDLEAIRLKASALGIERLEAPRG